MDFRNRHIDIVGKQYLWFGISGFVILVGLVSWIAFGLNLGIDFKGGGQLKYLIPVAQRPHNGNDVEVLNEARKALDAEGLKTVRLQITGGDTLLVSTDASTTDGLNSQEKLIDTALAPTFAEKGADGKTGQLKLLGRDMVGPVIGKELRNNAIKGVFLGILFIALWVYLRYNFAGNGARYALAGIIALIHDVFVLLGLMALIGHFFPSVDIDSSFIAALLTVVGYSINDSVVIFDRIRENLRERRHDEFKNIVNDSLLETMSRSVNTALTVIIMLLMMFFFGGESIHNFMLAMLIGVTTGMYSSIFIASMLLTAWHDWDAYKLAKASNGRAMAREIPTTSKAQTQLPSDSGNSKPVATNNSASSSPNKTRGRKRF
ncbi:MAG: protein translocase subunit SecF [Abditibacteriaceae bacterium]